MKKKEYIMPTIKIVSMIVATHILEASKENFGKGVDVDSRRFDSWDDDDEEEDSMWK